jgi:hypothetical protein
MTSSAASTDAGAESATAAARGPRRVPLWAIAFLGAVAALAYAVLVEKMRLGPPLVMLGLGGMTLGLAGAAIYRVIDPLSREPAAAAPVRTGRRLKELEREKQLVLKAIKEIELDYQMRKIAERDYREMVERYRARALRLITEIEAGDDYRALIERELAMRLKLPAAPAAAPPAPAPEAPARRTCAGCGAANDEDAQFCKKCGQRL